MCTCVKPHGTKYFQWTHFMHVSYTLVNFEEEEEEGKGGGGGERRGPFLSGLYFQATSWQSLNAPEILIPSWSLVNSSSLSALGALARAHCTFRSAGRTQQVWLPCAAPGKTGFHVLRPWNSLFAIQINIMSLITPFMKSVCRRMRLQSHKRQALQTSFSKQLQTQAHLQCAM